MIHAKMAVMEWWSGGVRNNKPPKIEDEDENEDEDEEHFECGVRPPGATTAGGPLIS